MSMITTLPDATEITASRKTRRRGYIPQGEYRPQQRTRTLLRDVHAVMQEYHAYLPLTIRQIYYRLVGAYGYDKTEAFYDRLCHHLTEARRASVIPFSWVRDDGVTVIEQRHFSSEDAF